MKQKLKSLIFSVSLLILMSCASKFIDSSAGSSEDCLRKGGSWYNDACWKNFENAGLSSSEVDAYVDTAMQSITGAMVVSDGANHPIYRAEFFPLNGDEVELIVVFGVGEGIKSIRIVLNKNDIGPDAQFEALGSLFNGDAWAGALEHPPIASTVAEVHVIDPDEPAIDFDGRWVFEDGSGSRGFSFQMNEFLLAAGNSVLEIKDTESDEAYLSGVLGIATYAQIKKLMKRFPLIKTIVMTNISGSIHDDVNMHTGRLLRENGFTTKVLADSDIASGGVDLFCAGTERIVEQGAKIGVHSWCCENDFTAAEIPKEHPAHQYQLAYFSMALGDVIGPEFYFFTLEAAPYDEIYYMTDEEIQNWTIATEFIAADS